MGAVYEVHDTELKTHVALKLLLQSDPTSLLKFKNEFRALQNIEHPNLVSLGELFEEHGMWFFTMELIGGVDFFRYTSGLSEAEPMPSAPATVPMGLGSPSPSEPAPVESAFDEQRLRTSLARLGRGLDALHQAGNVHCDVKPSNVLVEASGRLVIVDFGLVEVAQLTNERTTRVYGTPPYMAPERTMGHSPAPPADLYSVGVMMYQAMAGTLPFGGSPENLQQAKLDNRPRPLPDTVPADLAETCGALLSVEPEDRMTAAELVRRLDPEAPASAFMPELNVESGGQLFGRNDELTLLMETFQKTRAGIGKTVVVHGESGIGKTSLVNEFVRRVEQTEPHALVLRGRCFERESVPFQGFDGVITELTYHLAALPSEKTDKLLPNDPRAMARLFPALGTVPAIAATRAPHDVSDPVSARRRSVKSLRSLLTRLAHSRPLIVIVDDYQWSDPDAEVLLDVLMQTDGAPPLLLIVCAYVVPPLLEHADFDVATIPVGQLSTGDAIEFATSLLTGVGIGDEKTAIALAEEARRHPFYITELVRHASATHGDDKPGPLLSSAISHRVQALGEQARRILELVCVAAGPIPWIVVQRASSVEGSECLRHVAALRVQHMLRVRRINHQTLEPYHDHLRNSITEALPESARRRYHSGLANALYDINAHRDEPELLLRHLRGAGRLREAARAAERAARRAHASLAFTRAATLFGMALEFGHFGTARRRRLRMEMAWSLVDAGRGDDAAQTFATAAIDADTDAQRECYRMAAGQWLITGHHDRGMEATSLLLASTGDKLPATPRRALASIVWLRARLALRGLRWKPRAVEDPTARARLVAFQATAQSLLPVDTLLGTYANARYLLLALSMKDPGHVAVALGLEGIFVSGMGGRAQPRARKLFARIEAIADAHPDDPYLAGWRWLVDGFMAYLESNFDYAARQLARAAEQFSTHTMGTTWERNNSRLIHVFNLRYLGDINGTRASVHDYTKDAQVRGDKYMESSLKFGRNLVLLAADDPNGAEADVHRVIWSPGGEGFHLQHWYELEALAEIALYRGQTQEALVELAPGFKALSKSLYPRVQFIRVVSRWLKARLLLAANDPTGRGELRKLARQIAGEPIGYARVFAALVRAGAASRREDPDTARTQLRAALLAAEENKMQLCASAARMHLGHLVDGDEGSELTATSKRWMAEQGVRNPDAFCAIVAPGFR